MSWYARIEANSGWAVIAVLAIVSSATFLYFGIGPVEPVTSPLVAAIWRVSYGLSGLVVLAGILLARGDVEAAGLVWLAGALIINGFAVAIRPAPGAVIVSSEVAIAVVVLFIGIRVRYLARPKTTIRIEEPK